MKLKLTTGLATLIAMFLIATIAHAQTETQEQRTNRLREEERAANLVARRVPMDKLNGGSMTAGAWWTNSAIVAELGLTVDQKANIERAFASHSRNIVANTGQLEKEEQQLSRLLEAEVIDHSAVMNQTSRVIQARSETERETAVMTLEMREQLTRTQWMKLQSLEAQLSAERNRVRVQTAPAAPGGQRRQ